MLDYLYLEIPFFAFNVLDLGEGEQFNVKMPADLDQFRGDNSHGTIIGRKGLIQLGHSPTNRRRFFNEVYIISRVCQIKGGLHARNAATYDKNRSYGFFRHIILLCS
jgi:hypothetical protein